ncbi:MAG: diguanylate cyclase [Magnetovibrio sp.]|nr:diguanylate cyclase [Magnetovibrio sp.]
MTDLKRPLNLKPSSAPIPTSLNKPKWRVLVVDDEEEVHAVTKLILSKIKFKGRGLEILSAYSAAEAVEVLNREKDIAIVFLDVVMETDDAGLKLVKIIRKDMANHMVRIILRTGQPGQAPEENIIIDYDINDYKSKNELTAQKLFTVVISSLRAYMTITALDKNKRGLEKILESSSNLYDVESIQRFASGILTQLSTFIDCQAEGIICVEFQPDSHPDDSVPCKDIRILATSGEYNDCNTCPMDGTCKHEVMIDLIKKALKHRKNQISDDYTVLFFDAGKNKGTAALLHGGLNTSDENDRRILEVFTSKISIAFANAFNYQRMISAEEAAVTDYLTGLNNRRQLIRLGKPLASGAFRSGAQMAVAMLDIDHFKKVNDSLGHDAGDEVLRRMGQMLKERFRTSDVLARFGGEEFCIIAANLATEAAVELFDNFRKHLEEEIFLVLGKSFSVTVSIGICTKVYDNIDEMISRADQLLYQAKEKGRNCVYSS